MSVEGVQDRTVFVHSNAICESLDVGDGSRIWAFAHVMRGARIGRDCNIADGVFVESGAVIGDRVTVKNQVMIWNGVTLADDVFVGPGVVFTNDAFPRSPRMEAARDRYRDESRWLAYTQVQEGATIGAGATVLPGITIGSFATVGSGAVVTKDVRAHRLVVGNPAHPIGWVCICGQRIDSKGCCRACGRSVSLGPEEAASST